MNKEAADTLLMEAVLGIIYNPFFTNAEKLAELKELLEGY